MHFMKILAGLVIATLASPGIRVCAQAHVTENQTTYIYVDGKVGSDTNAGTQSTPLRTIQAAVNKASANNIKSIGTKVIINPGGVSRVVEYPVSLFPDRRNDDFSSRSNRKPGGRSWFRHPDELASEREQPSYLRQ